MNTPSPTVQEGYILIADISGYTRFLTENELQHAHAIIRELLGLIKEQMGAPVKIIRTEGDALFGYLPASTMTDAHWLLDVVEAAYHAFRDRLRHVEVASSCTCNACQNTGELDLKFFAHFGEFIVEDLGGGRPDLSGPEVIVAHRLLKNEFVSQHDVPAYFMVTRPVYAAMGSPEDAIDHAEDIEHFGRVDLHVFDLDLSLKRRREEQRRVVTEDLADWWWEWTFDAPKTQVWEALTNPHCIANMSDGVTNWTWSGDRRAGGATAHCAHGDGTTGVMNIVDWTPMEHYTLAVPAQGWTFPASNFSYHIRCLEDGRTQVIFAAQMLHPTWLQWAFMKVIGGQWRKGQDTSMERMAAYLAESEGRDRLDLTPRRVALG